MFDHRCAARETAPDPSQRGPSDRGGGARSAERNLLHSYRARIAALVRAKFAAAYSHGIRRTEAELLMKALIFPLLLMLVSNLEGASAADNLPAQTIVVFNTAVPDSESLAKFYAEKRGIA